MTLQHSPAKVPKKRGRPPLTKEYANPLESPMAHSSLKVQRQGTQSFSKPLMKVGQLTPKSKKRRQSSVGQNHSELNSVSPLKEGSVGLSPAASIRSSQMGTTKKGRYRGVILSTPVKASPSSLSNSGTPEHKKTSPMSLHSRKSESHIPLTPITASSKPQSGHSGHKNDHLINFSLSLNINSSGKATIGASPSDVRNDKVPQKSKSPCKTDVEGSNFQKKDVLFLLRKMKNGTANKAKLKLPKKEEEQVSPTFVEPKLPPLSTIATAAVDTKPVRLERAFSSERQQEVKPLVPCTPPAPSPMSPSNFFDFQMRTGLTPNVNGSLGVLSPFRMTLGTASVLPVAHPVWDGKQLEELEDVKHPQGTTEKNGAAPPKNEATPASVRIPNNDPYKQVVFKYSVGDPLLMNDEGILGDNAWQENINTRPAGMSPGKGKVFNTPPSFLNFGSPGSLLFSPPTQRRNSSLLVAPNTDGTDHVMNHINILRNHQRIINTTGKAQENALKSSKLRTPAVSMKESLGGKVGTNGQKDIYHNRVRSAAKCDSELEKAGDLSPGFEANKENPSPILPHTLQSRDMHAQIASLYESNATPKLLGDEISELPDSNAAIQGKSDDARLALRSLIKDKVAHTD